jgi:hypothetical protein
MSPKRDLYQRGYSDCIARAHTAPNIEVGSLWSQLASSYRFLLDREDRLEAEERERHAPAGRTVSFKTP